MYFAGAIRTRWYVAELFLPKMASDRAAASRLAWLEERDSLGRAIPPKSAPQHDASRDCIDIVYTLGIVSPLSVRHSIHGIHFEWHAVKAVANRRKHGVEFEQACEVFFDPFLRTLDADQEGEEAREAVLGLTEDWQFLYVVFVERGDAFRIVSARRATRAERRHYED